MTDQKLDNMLNLALSVSDRELERGYDLDTGYDRQDDTWEVIVKHNGNLDFLKEQGIQVTYLIGGYAVLIVPEDKITAVAGLPVIEYMEKPKSLYFAVNNAKADSCFTGVQNRVLRAGTGNYYFTGLTGKGTIVAVIDSGVDYFHPDFINEDGTTRILQLWDQSDASGDPPAGYNIGTEFDSEDINDIIAGPYIENDRSGHGTHVLGIATGNGRAGNGRYSGCAPECSIIVVKLGLQRSNGFPMTSELIQAIDYVLRTAADMLMPVAINISYGNSYGSHAGNSLLESYIDNAVTYGRSVIIAGAGNEGIAGRHASGKLVQTRSERIELAVYEYTAPFSIQIWKNYYDRFGVIIRAPDGQSTGLLSDNMGPARYRIDETDILVYYGEPTPYSISQEIYIDMVPDGDYFDSGIWTIELIPEYIVSGEYYMWLPAGAAITTDTAFLYPDTSVTLTIPAAGRSVITVGAYDSSTDAVAAFSGRGYTASGLVKPELVAPGVNIMSASPRGGYTMRTGTSMAAPFVAGAASCMMQWGIVEGRDPYLYGDKLKAYLIAGARKLPGFDVWPNPAAGWGALCLRDSLR